LLQNSFFLLPKIYSRHSQSVNNLSTLTVLMHLNGCRREMRKLNIVWKCRCRLLLKLWKGGELFLIIVKNILKVNR